MIDLVSGTEVAGYRVIDLIGAGGMGHVYRAMQLRLDRIVALKVIRPELAAEEAFREQFQQEARLAASIDHPAVVPIYEAGEADGELFVAMRWVDGMDLRQILKQGGRLEPDRAVEIASRVAEALQATHEVGLVHRDVKPSNILVEGRRVYLSDFGLARATAGSEALTQPAGFIGTADYAAPELLDDKQPVDGRADVYGLGCVLFEMLTGSVPFPADGLLAKLHAHAQADPPTPSALRPELPGGFDELVHRALAKDPADRYATPDELAAAAQEALVRPAPKRRARRRNQFPARLLTWRNAVAATALLAGCALLVFLISSPSGSDAGHKAGSNAGTTASGARKAPAATTLEWCNFTTQGPIRNAPCRNQVKGAVNYPGVEGETIKTRTMDLQVTGAKVLPALRSVHKRVPAPAGAEWIVVDMTVTNQTNRRQVFEPEPDSLGGRQTGLFIYAQDKPLQPVSTETGTDYSADNNTSFAALERPLAGRTLVPGRPTAGELAFSYPKSEVKIATVGFLIVTELGEPFNDQHSPAWIRFDL
jgi:predicted Ser/Thr protein kinase